VGVMDLESDRVAYFTDDHVRTLALLAPQVASSVENARLYQELAARERRMEEDLEAARELQQVLQPDAQPEIEGLDAACVCARRAPISGDIYRHFRAARPPDVVAFGDVSGKGAAAAPVWRPDERPLLRTLAPRRRRPAELMRALTTPSSNARWRPATSPSACCCGTPATRQIVMANAGALPPMICRAGEILKSAWKAVPLGLLDAREYERSPSRRRPAMPSCSTPTASPTTWTPPATTTAAAPDASGPCPLPQAARTRYTTYRTRVSKWSIIVRSEDLSVPARLKGLEVEVRQTPTVWKFTTKDKLMEEMERIHGWAKPG